jgi:uncharacterized protein YndB with AHSA1/START domain
VAGLFLRFESAYDLPPEVVWDALVDSDLVSGWLAEADVDARLGGRFDLDWGGRCGLHRTAGDIVDLFEPELLVLETDSFGAVRIELRELAGGTRGAATEVRVVIDRPADAGEAAAASATWLTALDQLEGLLRGHPVDWKSWENEGGAIWRAHLAGNRSITKR